MTSASAGDGMWRDPFYRAYRKHGVDIWPIVKFACDSPIEQLLLAAMFCEWWQLDDWKGTDSSAHSVDAFERLRFGHSYRAAFHHPNVKNVVLFSQAEVKSWDSRFILDFAAVNTVSGKALAVECDGHEWHQRTKEQIERDNVRHRTLGSWGYHSARFAGSEIWRDPFRCAADFVQLIGTNLGRRSERLAQ